MTNTNTTRPVTVGDLIGWLTSLNPDLPVQIAVNQEYQQEVLFSDLQGVVTNDPNFPPYVLIGE